MPRPLLPPRGIFVPTEMIYHKEFSPTVIHTWIQLRALAWGHDETPQINILQLSELTGKSRSTIFGHMALLRSWGALRWRSSDLGTIIVTFPADTGEFFLDGDSLPSHADPPIQESGHNHESNILEKPDPSLSSPINQLDINVFEERERENPDPDQEINQLHLSPGPSPVVGGEKFVQDSGRTSFVGGRSESKNLDQDTGEIQFSGLDAGSHSPGPFSQVVEDGADPIQIYRALTGIRPNKPQREQLKSLVQDMNIWYASVEHWQFHGWNPKNIAGILELYDRGGPDGCRYCSKNPEHQSSSLSALNQLRKEIKESSNGIS